MEEGKCPLCIDRRGKRWTEMLALGTKTIPQAMMAFAMTRADVEEHLYKHAGEQTFVKEQDSQYDREYYVKRLDTLGRDINRWIEEILDSEVNGDNIRALTALTREFRDTLRLLGEVTKILKDDEAQAAIAAVKEMQMRYLALTNIIVTQACPDCRVKVLAAVEEQKKLIP